MKIEDAVVMFREVISGGNSLLSDCKRERLVLWQENLSDADLSEFHSLVRAL